MYSSQRLVSLGRAGNMNGNSIFTFLFFLSMINCQEYEVKEVDIKVAKHCIQLLTQGMDGKKWLETRDKVYKLIGVLPENSELFLMAVGQRTIHLNISKTGSDWKSSVLDMTFMTKHNGSVSGISLEHNRQVCFPDNSLPKYYVPSMPEISWIFTLSTTEILENVDTHNKKSYVMLMDNEPDKSKWYHMATTRRHVIDLNSFDRLPFMLTKDTHLLCDVNMYYSTGLCKPCGEFCYGDGPNTPFCSGEKKQCSHYLKGLEYAWESKHVIRAVESTTTESRTFETTRARTTEQVPPNSAGKLDNNIIIVAVLAVLIVVVFIALVCLGVYCWTKSRRKDEVRRDSYERVITIQMSEPGNATLVEQANIPQAAAPPNSHSQRASSAGETASFQPNAHQTPPHTPSPPPGVTSNLLPNTQPIDGAVGGVEEQSGPQNTDVAIDIARLLRKSSLFSVESFLQLSHCAVCN
ncbi:uncharacterized protein LOC128242703 isoform X2 [Mya arenaria]|uniref:uncharacterized protein LOC128242703 isoform X2 n=1 Tax=Mya arenaria TaxID=6604 RepID=UPI0022E207FE|nr:uncharacterized protein LOC128242703 isoform X2 [Mya arenaria]